VLEEEKWSPRAERQKHKGEDVVEGFFFLKKNEGVF
jgi:hypothetical protein